MINVNNSINLFTLEPAKISPLHRYTLLVWPQVRWMDQQQPLDMTDYKNPDSNFQKMVSIIKYNVLKALDKHAEKGQTKWEYSIYVLGFAHVGWSLSISTCKSPGSHFQKMEPQRIIAYIYAGHVWFKLFNGIEI